MNGTNAWALWALMVVVGGGTFLLRFSFIGAAGEREVGPSVARVLRYVPPAVLAALVAASLLPGAGAPIAFDPRWLAALVAGAIAWRTRNVLLTIAVGMVALWALEAVVGAGLVG